MIVCPNGCQVAEDALLHICKRHTHALKSGKKFICKIENCTLEQTNA